MPAGLSGADRASGQDRRRLAGAALAAHSPRHVKERLGNDDDAPAAHRHIGQRAELEQRKTGVDPSLGHGQHPRQRGHPGRHAGHFPSRCAVLPPATKHVVLAALRRGRLPQLQELHPGAGERHSCPLRPRRLVRRLGYEQSMAAPVFGRMGGSRTHGPLRRQQGLERGMASIARTERRRIPRGRRRGQQAARHCRVVRDTARSSRPSGLGYGRGVRRRRRRTHARRATRAGAD